MGAKLTADMKRVVVERRLAFVATVCPDGTPNLSPKGTISVWDEIISSSPTCALRERSRTFGSILLSR